MVLFLPLLILALAGAGAYAYYNQGAHDIAFYTYRFAGTPDWMPVVVTAAVFGALMLLYMIYASARISGLKSANLRLRAERQTLVEQDASMRQRAYPEAGDSVRRDAGAREPRVRDDQVRDDHVRGDRVEGERERELREPAARDERTAGRPAADGERERADREAPVRDERPRGQTGEIERERGGRLRPSD